MTSPSSDNPVTAYPQITMGTLFARKRAAGGMFPFDGSGVQLAYQYARQAIWALCGALALGGQEVLVPSYVEGVELEALLRAGARPRFYPVTGSMRARAEDVLGCLTPDTRAVYVTHYLGFPQEIEALANACRQRGVLLVEDCAQALLSSSGPQALGTFGDAAVFSFRKSLPVPDGGLLVLRQPPPRPLESPAPAPAWPSRLAALGSALRNAPGSRWWLRPLWPAARRTARSLVPGSEGGDEVDPAAVFGMSKLSRALLARQDLEQVLHSRRSNYRSLEERLGGLLPPLFPLSEGVCPLLYAARVPRKQEALELLRRAGVEDADHWPAHHPLPQGQFPAADALHDTVIGLPCHQAISSQAMADLAGRIASLVEGNPAVFTVWLGGQTV